MHFWDNPRRLRTAGLRERSGLRTTPAVCGVGSLTYRYVYGLEKLEAVITGIPNGAGSVMQYIYDDLGEFVLSTQSPAGNVATSSIVKLYYHRDRLGTTNFLTDNVDGKVASFVA